MHQRHITFINHAIVILQFFICHANIASLVSVENREGRKEKEGKKSRTEFLGGWKFIMFIPIGAITYWFPGDWSTWNNFVEQLIVTGKTSSSFKWQDILEYGWTWHFSTLPLCQSQSIHLYVQNHFLGSLHRLHYHHSHPHKGRAHSLPVVCMTFLNVYSRI